ncbi:competence protein ComFC [Metabacillus crassostreae]|uniref:ComF family protein n=1 Tax=Metabacillus crassostreae TaxID=929098 RepID=UPI001EF7587E|nr:ComF family protein [Metabacillus crassostreae]MBM7606249.1 competence protein ComFC [Metabacillus crassostreae]
MTISCLICHEEYSQQVTWTGLLLSSDQQTCDECYTSLQKITGPTCSRCFRPQESVEICSDCQRWSSDEQWQNMIQKNISVFHYNDAMKDILAAFKFRGDAELVKVFQKDFLASYRKYYSSYKIDAAVPIPLSEERLYERGFNQAKLLADSLPLPQLDVLQRTHHEKQSKKSRHQRITASNVFSLKNSSTISNKKLLLIDDIYTTGSTLYHAAKVLIDHGAETVFSLTLIRS